jgi:hypothetical protein
VFWTRKKSLNEELAPSTVQDARPGAKGRATPRRRDQEAANRRPLVITDRKVARDTDKLRRKEALALQRQAMVTGDDAHLPARDKGPERRYIRNYIDARWSVGEIMLPVMLVVLLLSLVKTTWALTAVFVLVYGLVIVAIIDALLMWRRIKARLVTKFGAGKVPTGGAMYAVMRSFQIRPTRMPKPQVKRGDFPS